MKKIVPFAVGFRPGPWASAIGISRTTFYALPSELRPRSITLGAARIIVESPAEYLARIEQLQASPSAKTRVTKKGEDSSD